MKKGLGGRRLPEREAQHPVGKRWTSTMQSAMEEVNSLRNSADRDSMMQDLNLRKIANTKTSISFGHEKVSLRLDKYNSILNGLFIDVNNFNSDKLCERCHGKSIAYYTSESR